MSNDSKKKGDAEFDKRKKNMSDSKARDGEGKEKVSGDKGNGEKQKRTINNWRMKKQVDHGPLYEKNEARYPLPEVGTYVIVMVRETFERGYGEDGTARSVWMPDDSCVDAWKVPLRYRVAEYKKGIENPLDRGNAVRLEATMKSGYTYVKTLPTIPIAVGYYHLHECKNGDQIFKTFRISSKDCPVAEKNPRLRKKEEKEREEARKKAEQQKLNKDKTGNKGKDKGKDKGNDRKS